MHVPTESPASVRCRAGGVVARRIGNWVVRLTWAASAERVRGDSTDLGHRVCNTGHEQAIADVLKRYGPMRAWGPDAIGDVFLHDVDPAVARDSERFQGAAGEGMFAEPWPLDAWPDVATRVLVPRGDRLFPRDFQRRVARERLGLEIDEMAGGHLPMLSRPRELAERLVELARAG
jgi:hypothetical protein